MEVKIRNEMYELTEQQFSTLKAHCRPRSLEIKESLGWEEIIVKVGDVIIGYVSVKILDGMIDKFKKSKFSSTEKNCLDCAVNSFTYCSETIFYFFLAQRLNSPLP